MHEPPTSSPAPLPSRPTPPPGRRLPAAFLAFLYMFAWLVISQTVGSMVLLALLAAGAQLQGRNVLEDLQGTVQGILQGELPIIPVVLATGIPGLAAGLFLIYIFGVLIEGRPFSSYGFERVRGWWLHWAAGFGLDAAHMTLIFLVGLGAGWYRVVSTSSAGQAILIFVVALALALPAAAAEEVTLRGYVFQTLERRYGAVWATVVNSVVFALLHLANPGTPRLMAVLGLILAGVYFSVAYLATRQLWLPIAGHTVWNVFEGPVFGLPVSGIKMPASIFYTEAGGPDWLAGGAFGPEAGLIVVVTTALWIPLVWWIGRRLPGACRPLETARPSADSL